jgi:hypothetical protein
MPNVDDIIFEFTFELTKEIFESAKFWSAAHASRTDTPREYVAPEEKLNEWREKLFHFDVSTWTPRDDDRALPGIHYGNRLSQVLEFQAYEVKSDMMRWLERLRLEGQSPEGLNLLIRNIEEDHPVKN